MDSVDAPAHGRRTERAAGDLMVLEQEPGFGGLRIDDDGVIEVSFASDVPPSAQVLIGASPVPVRVRRVEHAWADLLGYAEALGRKVQDLRRQGAVLFVFGPDVATNRLHVEVQRLTPEVERMVRAVVPGAPLTLSGAQAGPDHPPVCDTHYPMGPITLAGKACPVCGERTNSRYVRCPDCSRRTATCVLCGEPAVHGL